MLQRGAIGVRFIGLDECYHEIVVELLRGNE